MIAALSQLPPFVIIGAYALFWSWEAVSAARLPAGPRFRRARNIALTALTIGISTAIGAGLLLLSGFAEHRHLGLLAQMSMPYWSAVILGLAALDLADYWRHRLSHHIPVLWRLHRLHHSDPAMDVTTTFRSHPIEFLIRGAIFGVAVIVLGVPSLSLLLMPVLQLPILIFQHANIRLPPAIDRALALLITTPGMHLVHHSREEKETNSNYATFISIWDRMFLSFRRAVPQGVGLNGFDGPRYQTLVGMILAPWR